ncbi:hypothetical protein [Paenibacillus riograndensis]|uniref:Uncharacterized protein n=1 Tax=Paenibacillus riograndensis SBR5 TaxID=1073571 RepID=A0A0E4CWX9_9BACL|nr:hypothetical protein [Paenibacillus riograndensis]CQR55770.1 hypothetical protein PRIO_3367 [Paenibacillus riograndensis SBR5]
MLNQKKIEMAFKKYKKNFVNGMIFDKSKAEYEENKSEVISIVESSNKEKDHILLIDLESIYSYHLSMWKKEVLINGSNRLDELKQMQLTLFYQCMAQDLYKIRYPHMMVDYSFMVVISTLIHFTMYGWEKEENILFDFIIERLGQNTMSANDWNKHTWFLLELYLQYRDKTIYGTNQNLHVTVKEKLIISELKNALIPEDLDIYAEVLERWSTPDGEEVAALINKMIIYHSNLASELGTSIEFGDYRYGFYPYEILFLIHIRKKLSLPVPEHFDDLLMNTPEAKMVIEDPEAYPAKDPMLELIDNFYRNNYPEYVPKQYKEKLFQ